MREDAAYKQLFYRKRTLKKRGCTPAVFDQLVLEQDGRCAICGEIPEQLVADHNHRTGNFRALLCGHCNKGLGFFKEDGERLFAAIRYLSEWRGL